MKDSSELNRTMEENEVQEDQELDAMQDKGQWFVVHTLSGHENKVKNTIEKHLTREGDDIKIYEVLIPTEQVAEVRKGKKTTSTRKFFPGYILIRMDLYDPETKQLNEKAWYFVRQTQGIIGFIGSGHRENEDEQVLTLQLKVDGKVIAKPAEKYDCNSIEKLNFECNKIY